MVFQLSAYRVDWPPEAGVGRTRFYGVDDYARMEMHLHHGANFNPRLVPLFKQAEEVTSVTDPDSSEKQVFIDYTNYRGERAWRLIDCAKSKIRFGVSQFHTEPQWLMTALDVSKGEEREFAVKDIHEARTAVTTVMQFQLNPKDQLQGSQHDPYEYQELLYCDGAGCQTRPRRGSGQLHP